MQLWTDYEGVTIEGAFHLRKLLMPEGRSAFFSTIGPNGEPTVVRVIECHFDEDDILARWRSLDALNHPNFLKFERFGQTELDGRPVVYAVFEKVDGNLAEVLDQGHLSLTDVSQLASSLVTALEVLHTHGFIHEHIEPRNVFALDNVVKLRGDCIREAPEGDEGRVAKQRDVRDLATVLLQGLTQRESLQGVSDSAMPPPFSQIIRNGINGTWGLENIRAALGRQFGANQPAAPLSPKVAPTATATPAVTAAAQKKSPDAPAKSSTRSDAQLPLPLLNEGRSAESSSSTAHQKTSGRNETLDHKEILDRKEILNRKDAWKRKDHERGTQNVSLRSHWIGAGIGVLLLLLCAWLFAHVWSAHKPKPAATAATSQPAAQPANQIAPNSAPSDATNPAATNSPRTGLPAQHGSQADWRVIVFTYNRRSDAQKKATAIASAHPNLAPEVFTPTGHAPYLVSIGGLMDSKTAHALAHRSRSLHLPRDMYAQNYPR
jgi:hypothetical protein